MPSRDSEQQRRGVWGSSKFIIVLSIALMVIVAGTVLSLQGTSPADAPEHQQAEKAASTSAATEPASKQEVQTPSGSSKDQPSEAPKP